MPPPAEDRTREAAWRAEDVRLGRLLLVPVGCWDVRAARAVGYASQVPARSRRALHVVTDEAAANYLADAWMERGRAFPLYFAENEGGVAATVARVVALELASGFDEIMVILGQLALRRRVHRLLHDRTADAIARALGGMPSVAVGLLSAAST